MCLRESSNGLNKHFTGNGVVETMRLKLVADGRGEKEGERWEGRVIYCGGLIIDKLTVSST